MRDRKGFSGQIASIEEANATEFLRGVDVVDIESCPEINRIRSRRRDASWQLRELERVAFAIREDPDTVLERLVNVAMDLCDADGAGVSMEQSAPGEDFTFRLAATAGCVAHLRNAVFPGSFSPSTICLERGRPQRFRLANPYFKSAGVSCTPLTDGIMIPWRVNDTKATIWIASSAAQPAFDLDDLAIMQLLAGIAALSVAQQDYSRSMQKQWAAAAASAVAQMLARRVNAPLQKLARIVSAASDGKTGKDAKMLASQLSEPLSELTLLVSESLGPVPITRVQ